MGKIIKINIYAERRNKSDGFINIKIVEKNILKYNNWLKKTNREDKMENYEEFLQFQ